ncbi:MAG: PAS domain S-box protein [Acidobacteria bacterium]|nr:PAS domain S-box protein [Acidobacteriota bacterium]
MVRDLKGQLISALLVVLTAAALIAAGINFQQHRKWPVPDDGVTWVDRADAQNNARVQAMYIAADSAAERAGIKPDDTLLQINGLPIHTSTDVARALLRLGVWKSAEYVLNRGGIELKAKVIISERSGESSLYYQYFVGLAYLGIGLFVYFRRGRAPRATHFYILCLASFVLSTFHYTGKLNGFDKVIYWGNVGAGLMAPTIFLHFCLRFPEVRPWFRGWWKALLLYTPALAILAVYIGFSSGVMRSTAPLGDVRWALDRVWMFFLALAYLTGAAVAAYEFRRTQDPIVRQQMKWIRNGAVLGVVPFACLNVLPYAFGFIPGPYLNMAVLSLLLVPASWAYAILRYRLMDVDLIFQQGYAYTVATLAVIGVFYGLVITVGPFEELNPEAMVLLILIATFIFQPIRNWIQDVLDRYWFYRDRYDYRRTLIEFVRELSSERDLGVMLDSVTERLKSTLYIQNVEFFLLEESTGRFRPMHAHRAASDLDLSFLTDRPSGPLFFERTHHQLDVVLRHLPHSVRQTISRLDLTYYLPCSVRGRTVAYLGVGRTQEGDFLSTEDLELLTTISGYVSIAIENALLYRSLERKVAEYERLKEFSENIVESINVGIVAADLEDRVESWNTQMEALTGVKRADAVGRTLSELLPLRLAATLEHLRGESGIHHIYKSEVGPAPLESHAGGAPHVNGSNGAAANGNGSQSAVPSKPAIVNIAVAPLVTKEGEQIGRLIIFDNVTERAELEQQLLQADKLSSIGLLAAGVAHEVNTPLAVISTYAQMLAKQITGDDPKAKLLEKIAKQTFRASEIVNSLLNFSRTSKTEYEEVEVNRVLRDTLSLIEHQLDKARVRVEFTPAAAEMVIRGNSGKMQQVFLNLFLNARDAMDSGGTLGVHCSAEDKTAKITISDSGHGIQPEDLPRIFDPFFTTKGAKRGTGLGLSVTYGIVREHGGTIDAHSEPGRGARFELLFPLLRPAPPAQDRTAVHA